MLLVGKMVASLTMYHTAPTLSDVNFSLQLDEMGLARVTSFMVMISVQLTLTKPSKLEKIYSLFF